MKLSTDCLDCLLVKIRGCANEIHASLHYAQKHAKSADVRCHYFEIKPAEDAPINVAESVNQAKMVRAILRRCLSKKFWIFREKCLVSSTALVHHRKRILTRYLLLFYLGTLLTELF